MAENFANEGLDRILSFIPQGTTSVDQTLYIASLTTSGAIGGTGTTALDGNSVPYANSTWVAGYSVRGGEPALGGTSSGPGNGGYQRKSITAATWGAPTANGSVGRVTTATSAQSMATSTGAWIPQSTIGAAIVTAANAGSGIAYFYANYSDNSTVAVNSSGIVLQLTPFWELDI
jgi:hypothetical protein